MPEGCGEDPGQTIIKREIYNIQNIAVKSDKENKNRIYFI